MINKGFLVCVYFIFGLIFYIFIFQVEKVTATSTTSPRYFICIFVLLAVLCFGIFQGIDVVFPRYLICIFVVLAFLRFVIFQGINVVFPWY